jgi:SET domain-containing protein
MVSTIGDGIEIKESTIPDSGNGLFVTKDFKKNDWITFYDGKEITREEAQSLKERGEQSHVRSLDINRTAIDGLRIPEYGRGGASFANHKEGEHANSAFRKEWIEKKKKGITKTGNVIILVAKRDIKKGEEVFVDYGKDYWKLAKKKEEKTLERPNKDEITIDLTF